MQTLGVQITLLDPRYASILFGIMDSLTAWSIAFVLSNITQLALVSPRMLSCTSMSKIITISYIIGVLGDTFWHIENEDNATAINTASLFYVIGTIPFVYNYFRGSSGTGLKMAMAALYALNIYTFGDPNETDIPFFLEKHMANHLGSTLFYYVAANAKYQM